ncbi:MAG: response regulator transcription factor [Deltaproteobacteria bacterium]
MKSILLVDDEKDILESLGASLRRNGYRVFAAPTGREALVLAKRERPQLIILDLILPDVDGSDVAARLLGDPETRDIPVIFLTSIMTKEEQHTEGTQVGKRCVVAKPCRPEEILAHVKDCIGSAD